MFVLGIDPGVQGAYAWREEGVPPNCDAFENSSDLWAFYKQFMALPFETMPSQQRCVAFLEEVSGFTGTRLPGRSMFTFGRSFGRLEALLVGTGFEIVRVRPQVWQKHFSALSRRAESKAEHKRRLVALARERLPTLREKINLQTADACLLMLFGWQLAAENKIADTNLHSS